MKLKREKFQKLLDDRGWSELYLARKLGLDYSYVFRIMRGDRGIGKKFIGSLMKLCEKEGLNFRDFISLDDKE